MSALFFPDAWLLWLLLPLLGVWLFAWWRMQGFGSGGARRATAALRFSSLAALRLLKPSGRARARRGVQGLRVLTLLLLVLAMTRPQTGRERMQVNTEGVDIMLAVDTSGSMRALDLDSEQSISQRRNRLEVVKDVVAQFVQQRENDQLGLVVFGEHAFTQCPLTLDHGIVASFLQRLEIGMAGDMTAVGSALGTAVKRLKDSKAKSKVVVLLTDGRSNAGRIDPKQAAEIAKSLGVKVYTIGAGTRGKAPFLVEGLFGQRVAYDDVKIDELTLQQVASTTGGAYFRAEDAGALRAIYDKIDALETTDLEMPSYWAYQERFAWFVLPALALLLFEVILLGTRLRKIP